MAKTQKKAEVKQENKSPVVKKSGSKKYLAKVPEATVFWCHDGQVFDGLDRLITGFDLMSDETFFYHANEEKNDFSCWIIEVIGDAKLGNDIKKAKNKKEAKQMAQDRSYDLSLLED
jgi:hypothetical protein